MPTVKSRVLAWIAIVSLQHATMKRLVAHRTLRTYSKWRPKTMPFESRLFIKTGIVFLVLTFAIGAALLIAIAAGQPVPFVIEVVHGHMGFVGWLVNVVIGVALWMFPLDRERYPITQGRYPATAPLWCYYLLNIGLVLRVVVEPWHDLGGGSLLSGVLLGLSGVMQFAAIIIFVNVVWNRTRGPNRPAPGVR